MPNDMSNPRSPGRVFLPSRMPTNASPNQSGRREGQTTPPSSPPSPPRTPLTPYNTFASRDGSTIGEDFDFAEAFATARDADPHSLDLSDLDDELLNDEESVNIESPFQEDGEDQQPFDTRSEPLPDTSNSSDKTVIHTRPLRNQRSASMPPLKSALIRSASPARTSDVENCERKRARFNEDAITEEFIPQEAVAESIISRGRGTSDRDDLMRRIQNRDPHSQHARSYHTSENEEAYDKELAVAVGLFEEMVEELVQVAEEHADAHEQLAGVAHGVVEAIMDCRSDKTKDSSALGIQEDSATSYEDENEGDRGLRISTTQNAADEDVDETCIGNPAMDVSDESVASDEEIETREMMESTPDIRFWPTRVDTREQSLDPIIEESSSSTGSISIPTESASEVLHGRRVSDSHMVLSPASRDTVPRRASMSEFTKLKGRLRLLPRSPKAEPAGCAVTACSIRAAESPKLNTVYEHPGARYKMFAGDKKPTKMAQTVRSDSGTLQVLWIEPAARSGSDLTLLDSNGQAPEVVLSEEDEEIVGTPSPMDKVKTKLAAWSWAREQGLETEHGGPNWIPLLPCDDAHSPFGASSPRAEEPYAPPNTASTTGRPSGASSAKHSAPHTPLPESRNSTAGDEDEDDHPLELKVKATLSRPASTVPTSPLRNPSEYLSLPTQPPRSKSSCDNHLKAVSRELSNLAFEDTHFKTHRDSLVLLNRRKDEGKMNQQLMNSRDSVVLARSKFDGRYPRSVLDTKPAWSRMGGLSPIPDASPPDPRVKASLRTMEKAIEGQSQRNVGGQDPKIDPDQPHLDEHTDCPICEVERPRWFEANCKKGAFV